MEIINYYSDKQLSQKKLEEYAKYCELAKWGRRYPVKFSEEILGQKWMDYQAYCFYETWRSQFAVWAECRGAGKDTLSAGYHMTRFMLIPNYKVWTLSNSYAQSMESLGKLRDIALKRLPSFKNLTDIFARELDKSETNSDTGFVQTPTFHFRLFNDSGMEALSSNMEANRGKRGAVWFNETAWMSQEQLAIAENFANVDSSFSLGTKEIEYYDPQQMPLQVLYTSSVGDVTFPFYDKYERFFKRMLIGDKKYFAYDVNAYDILYHTTVDGIPQKSHISEDQITKAIAEDQEKADRELFNKFRRGGGANAMVTAEEIVRNSTYRVPELRSMNNKDKYILLLDPARSFDGSALTIYKVINDKEVGFRLELVNSVEFVDTNTKNKTPLPFNQQVEKFKEYMCLYNGERTPDWQNIEIYIDSGAGGGGYQFADSLMEDWIDKTGRKRSGVIDPDSEQFETSRKTYKNAIPIVHMLNPKALRDIMFDTLSRFIKLNLINFTNYDNRDTITIIDEKGKEKIVYLNDEEKISLMRTEVLKTQLSYMCRNDNGTSVKYALAKEKINTMHDDLCYTLAMAAYALSLKRKDDLNSKKQKLDFDPSTMFQFRKPVLRKY